MADTASHAAANTAVAKLGFDEDQIILELGYDDDVDEALRRRAPGPALLVITGASNVTGEVWPVAELARVGYENLSIEQVAHAVGYTCASRFSELFRRETGLLPSEYRRGLER